MSFTISSVITGSGSVSPVTPFTAVAGSSQEFTFTPDVGYSITDVSIDGYSLGVVSSFLFEDIYSNYEIEIIFTADDIVQHTVTSSTGINGTISPLGDTLVTSGEDITYTISPDLGFSVDELIIDDVPEAGALTYTFTAVATDHSIVANFIEDPLSVNYTVTFDQRNNGTIYEQGSTTEVSEIVAQSGETVILSITPDSGFTVSELYDNGVDQGSLISYTIPAISEDHIVRARFVTDTSLNTSNIELMNMEEITVIRRDFDAGSYVNGYRVVGDSVEITMFANVQPGNTEHGLQAVGFQVIQEADFDKLNRSWKFYTFDEIKPKDLIRLDSGEEFEILDVDDWTRYNLQSINYRSMGRRIKP